MLLLVRKFLFTYRIIDKKRERRDRQKPNFETFLYDIKRSAKSEVYILLKLK